jgi:hypothetical protein
MACLNINSQRMPQVGIVIHHHYQSDISRQPRTFKSKPTFTKHLSITSLFTPYKFLQKTCNYISIKMPNGFPNFRSAPDTYKSPRKAHKEAKSLSSSSSASSFVSDAETLREDPQKKKSKLRTVIDSKSIFSFICQP